MKKFINKKLLGPGVIALALSAVLIGLLTGFGLKAATANGGEIEWELVEERLGAEVEASTTFGLLEAGFVYRAFVGGEATWTVELQTPFAEVEKVLDLANGDEAKVEFQFNEDGVPTEVEAEVKAFDVEGCGDISIEMKWQGGEFETILFTLFDEEGEPLERHERLQIPNQTLEIEITEAEVCGLDLLGEASSDLEGEIRRREIFEPAE